MSGAIVAIGGGGLAMGPGDELLDAFVLSLALRDRPRICFLGTASGDSERSVASFYRAFAAHDCQPTDLSLFDRTVVDLRTFVLEQDVLYAGAGNTASLLAVWRAHGLDAVLGEALVAGAVLAGVGAGMDCWFDASVTDALGSARAPLNDGLGFLAGSGCGHYDAEEQRRPIYHRLVAAGFPAGCRRPGRGAAFREFRLRGRGRRLAGGRPRLSRRTPARRRRHRACAAHALPVVTPPTQ